MIGSARLTTLSLALWLSVGSAPVTADTAPGSDSEPASSAAPATHADLERAALRARLDDIRRLLSRLDDLETQLIAQAEQALDRADAARSHDERARQERLYGEIGARIAELRATRRDIAHQLQALEQALDGAVTSQPTQPDR